MKNMTTRIGITLTLVSLCASLFSGCVLALGNSGVEPKGTPTLGRQLMDLKQARSSGALTEDEYQAAKKRLVEGR